MKKILLPPSAMLLMALAGCGSKAPNAKPEFGETGLPKNCRAYVQSAINDYRTQRYSADEVMAGLERNCGERWYIVDDRMSFHHLYRLFLNSRPPEFGQQPSLKTDIEYMWSFRRL